MNELSSYKQQRKNAKRRGIPFLLTFQQWADIWLISGHWEQRGRGANKYCMARLGDCGAYEIGNVKIITHQQNSGESITRLNKSPGMRAKVVARNKTLAQRAVIIARNKTAKMRSLTIARNKSRVWTDESRHKLSASRKLACTAKQGEECHGC